MKLGDSVYCILDNYNGLNSLVHKRGNIYKINYILHPSPGLEFCFFVTSEAGSSYCDKYGYNSESFYLHFIDIKEYRKLKLEKISESNL